MFSSPGRRKSISALIPDRTHGVMYCAVSADRTTSESMFVGKPAECITGIKLPWQASPPDRPDGMSSPIHYHTNQRL